jgi:hypothetical protein
VSLRTLTIRVRSLPYAQGAAKVEFHAIPSQFTLPAGRARRVLVTAAIKVAPIGNAPAEGAVVFAPTAGAPLHLPWEVTFARPATSVIGQLRLSTTSFTPSDAGPALLTFRAGRLALQGGQDAVQPIALLTLDLFDDKGKNLGTLATLRDLLPGRYAFGLTGRTPAGNTLDAGNYRLQVTAVPNLAAPPTTAEVTFTIK